MDLALYTTTLQSENRFLAIALAAAFLAIAVLGVALQRSASGAKRLAAEAVSRDREASASEVRLLMAMRGRQECCGVGSYSGMGGPPECCCDPRVLVDAEDVIDAILVRRPGLPA